MDTDLILRIVQGKPVPSEDMENVPAMMTSEESTDSLKAAFLASLYMRNLSTEEVSGFARGLRHLSHIEPVKGCTDIVGTGGDMKGTINVSTAASILCSSMGIRIAKHGNTHITSKSGGADFMEGTGYKFPLTQKDVLKQLNTNNYAFILASACNPSFRDFSEVRRSLGFKTIFNLMGPITNPVNPEKMVLGCSDAKTQETFVDIMNYERKEGIVVRGLDGMDEISFSGKSSLRFTGSKKERIIDFYEITSVKVSEESVTGGTREDVFLKNMEGLAGKNLEASAFIGINAAPAIMLNNTGLTFNDAYRSAMKQITSGSVISHLNRITEGKISEVVSDVR